MSLTSSEIQLARVRIREWPIEERMALTRMTEHEVTMIMLIAALFDARPLKGGAL